MLIIIIFFNKLIFFSLSSNKYLRKTFYYIFKIYYQTKIILSIFYKLLKK